MPSTAPRPPYQLRIGQWIVNAEARRDSKGRLAIYNALRHTFASMHLAMWSDEAKLQTLMGHESGPMLHRHYKALKTKKEAERFWSLVPDLEKGRL